MFDLRMRFPFSWLICGGSGCGKTTMTLNFLRSFREMTDNPNCKHVVYCYNEWQDAYEIMSQEGIVTEWVQGLMPMTDIKEKIVEYKNDGGCVLVIDDFGHLLTNAYGELFTVLSHHNNCSILLLTQNLFDKNPVFRTISLNATYISVFKNPRDSQQIVSFAKQIKPGHKKFIVDSFREATKTPYSYLFFDTHQKTLEQLRIRSCILPREAPMCAWIPNNI